MLASLVIFAVSYILVWVAARWMLPSSVQFGELHTFRDLALVLAAASTKLPSSDRRLDCAGTEWSGYEETRRYSVR
jgi:hypothetical protein